MYQPLIKFHPYPAIFTQVLRIFAINMAHEALKIQKDRTSGRRALQAINHPAGERHCAASLTLYFICKLVSWGWAI